MKLKDLDYISYKLFKKLIQIKDLNPRPERGSAETHAKEIQNQYQQLSNKDFPTTLKKLEFFLYGALSAYRNKHYKVAFAFLNQGPILTVHEGCIETETMGVVLAVIKRLEVKILCKMRQYE